VVVGLAVVVGRAVVVGVAVVVGRAVVVGVAVVVGFAVVVGRAVVVGVAVVVDRAVVVAAAAITAAVPDGPRISLASCSAVISSVIPLTSVPILINTFLKKAQKLDAFSITKGIKFFC
jgi:UDP-3-O-[3-hydroxymyristoyl] glucosamine N-acyltransferase